MAFVGVGIYAQGEVGERPDSTKMLFGYLSYDSAMQAMPEYVQVQQQMAELREQYDAEMKRVENDFNKKYEEFLDGQREFPKTILTKRQTELKELMERNLAFKSQSRRELRKAEAEAYAPLHQRLREVLAGVSRLRGYAFVLNTDSNACPYIDPTVGEDINQTVQDALK